MPERLAAPRPRIGQSAQVALASAPPAVADGRAPRAAGADADPSATPAALPGAGGELSAQRDAPLGGQAVIEGVMMRGVSTWALAVRKPAPERPRDDAHTGGADANGAPAGEPELGEIEVTTLPLDSALKRHRLLRLPIVRGVVALGGSLAIGFRALELSANAQLPAEDAPERGRDEPESADRRSEQAGDAPAQQEIPKVVWAGTVIVAVALAIVLFFLVPVGLTSLIKHQLGSSVLFWLVEGLIRTTLFLAYMLALSRVRDLRRVFEYHGAEHKTISCYEAGLALTPVNAQRFSRLHPRCGTSFLLIVMIVAIFVFAPIGLPAWYWLFATRVLGVPVIAGISFEIIKFAGRNRRRRWVQALMWPGLKLQLLTTREPDLHQLAVAIAALNAVLVHETPGELSAADLVGVEVVA
jgi:uncharacterized protein YqhQ